MANHIIFDVTVAEPGVSAPHADRIVSGNPQFKTWSLEEDAGGIYSGIWEATPGKWRIAYDEWEYFNVLSGHSVVTEDGGEPVHLRAGDRMILRPGFTGTWEVIETTRKDYVVRL
jgi:uncharacterized cupin superfamily protein